MLDISRNFRDKDFILKQLDAMATLKMSTLHLHLTDDAGWRIQIDACPELTRKAAWRVGRNYEEWRTLGCQYSEEGSPSASGGYLTKADVKEIVGYASARHIDIIPEIELPGHSGEVLAAYPDLACLTADGKGRRNTGDLCPGKDKTFEMFETILDEVWRCSLMNMSILAVTRHRSVAGKSVLTVVTEWNPKILRMSMNCKAIW